jgi:hypothetical protein
VELLEVSIRGGDGGDGDCVLHRGIVVYASSGVFQTGKRYWKSAA